MKRLILLFLLWATAAFALGEGGTIQNGGGGGANYPSGTGIPLVSSGTSWGTTVTLGSAYNLLQINAGATAPVFTDTLTIDELDLTSGTSSIPWTVGTTTWPTAEGSAKWDSTNNVLYIGDGAAAKKFVPQTNEKLAVFNWDGGGVAVTTGANTKRCTLIPSAATIVGVYAIADASTTSHFHVYQDAFATGARSTTVTGAVDIGATLGSVDTTLTGWDKSITAADEICISVESNNNAKWLNIIIYGTR
jgi:hypothetical protein